MTMTSSDGKSIILHVAEPGELIGLQGAISGKAYEVSAETLEPCQVNFIKREAFERLIHDHRDVGAHVTGQFSNDYQAACVQIRVAGAVSHGGGKGGSLPCSEPCAHGRGSETNQGIRMNVALTHEEIAQVVGVSRETVYLRTLSDLPGRSL